MLRIATINTWKGEGDYERRLSLFVDGLRKEKDGSIRISQKEPDAVDNDSLVMTP